MNAREKAPISLPPLVSAMQMPEFYPHSPPAVQFLQTHISYVFLAGALVYKVKKPVDFGFLDYSTPRKRAYWCRRERELNQPLAPGVYLGVEKIYRRGRRFSLRPPGKVVDYAVVMKRLPEERFLSSLMEKGRATVAQARRIARRVASFHATAPTVADSRLGVLRKNLDENFRQTEPYIGRTVTRADYDLVYDYSRHFLRKRTFILRKRIAEGRVRDGHGDLHAEHICLTDPMVIYDCLEFSSRLRRTDVAAEVAFLYMDLLHHRHPHLARAFAEEYIDAAGDWEIRLLLSFYACYRAVVREKVESMRFADRHVPAAQRREARRRAARYFHLARDLARRDGRPRLTAVGGLPGTGKSTLARLWAERLGAAALCSDAVRKELAGAAPGPGRRDRAGWREGIYTPSWTKRTYEEMMARAERLLRAGESVVVDATFARRAERRLAAAVARRAGARYVTVECRCPEKIIRRRLAKRKEEGVSLSDADWSVYRRTKGEYSSPRRETVRVSTVGDLEIALAKIAAAAFPL